MCRLVAYAGTPVPISSLLFDSDHSLEHQAYAPRELLSGTVNVDGTGVAWWDAPQRAPGRYVTETAPWADANLGPLSRRIQASHFLGAVRSATPGLGFGSANVAPFTSGVFAGAHNGWIGGFRGALGKHLVGELSNERFGELATINDSKVLFLLAVDKVMQGAPLRVALAETLRRVGDRVRAADESAPLNLVIGDGETFVATRHTVGGRANSLYWRSTGDSTVIASEPHDDGADWKAVPEDHLIEITSDDITVLPIKGIT